MRLPVYGLQNTSVYRMVQSIFRYLEPLRRDSRVWQTDGRTDFAITNAALTWRGQTSGPWESTRARDALWWLYAYAHAIRVQCRYAYYTSSHLLTENRGATKNNGVSIINSTSWRMTTIACRRLKVVSQVTALVFSPRCWWLSCELFHCVYFLLFRGQWVCAVCWSRLLSIL